MKRIRLENGKFGSNNPLHPGGVHKCNLCGIEKEATTENFRILNKGKSCESLNKTCRECVNKKQREMHERRKSDPAFIESRRKTQEKYRRNNRVKCLLKNYQGIDKRKGQVCTLSLSDIEALVSNPCVYCGDTERIGLDRIDNSKPHILGNVQPCCPDCNICRSDRFTVGEMMGIGKAIRSVKIARIAKRQV